jgi:hypothetical protein
MARTDGDHLTIELPGLLVAPRCQGCKLILGASHFPKFNDHYRQRKPGRFRPLK